MDFDAAVNNMRATVVESLPNALVRVETEDLRRVVAHVAPRRNKDFLRLRPGDRVEIELSPRDPGRARVRALLK